MTVLNELLAADNIDLTLQWGAPQWIGLSLIAAMLAGTYLVLRSWWRYVRDLHADLDELAEAHSDLRTNHNDLLAWLDEHLNGVEDNHTPTGRHAHGATRVDFVSSSDIDAANEEQK